MSQDRGRLDDPGDDEVTEHLVPDHVEPQVRPRSLDDVDQQPRELRLDDRLNRARLLTEVEVENALACLDLAARDPDQQRKLGFVMGRAEMLHDHVTTVLPHRDLHCCRP